MLKGNIFAVSALLLTAAMPAIAQDATTNDPTKDSLKLEEGTGTGMEQAPGDSAEAPAAKPADASGFMAAQQENQWLANDYIGETAYSSDGQEVGEVDDLIVGEAGTIEGVTIAVGGFLGMGARAVAVPFESIQETQDENGDTRLILPVAAADLETAPEFVTLRTQRLEEEAMKAAQEAEQQSTIVDPAQ